MFKNILPILLLLSSSMANDEIFPPYPGGPFPYPGGPFPYPGGPYPYPGGPNLFPDNSFESKPKRYEGPLALGSDNESGLLWVVMCLNTSHGNVPGKLDKDDNASYAWGGEEHKCSEWEQVQGILYSSQNEIPSDCEAKGRQNDSSESHHNVVVPTEYGMIPGKGLSSNNTAWYGYDGKEFSVNDNFYYVC